MHTYTERQATILSEIIHLVYTDVLSRKVWEEILLRLGTIMSHDYSACIFNDLDDGLPSWWVGNAIDEAFFDQFKARYHLTLPILAKALAVDRSVWRPEDIMPGGEWRNAEVYKQLAEVYHLKNFVTLVVKHGTGAALIMCLMRVNAASAFTDKEVEILNFIQPHIAAAFERASQADDADGSAQVVFPSLDGTANPFFVFDHNYDLKHMNDTARVMYEAAEDKQAALDDLTCAAASVIVTEALRGTEGDQPEAIFHVDAKKFRLALFPLQSPGPRPWYVMFASDIGFHLRERYERAMAAFGLSARESEVCLMLIRGFSNRQIAENMQLTELTVKDHVKSIREKTGVSSRNQVLQKLLIAEA